MKTIVKDIDFNDRDLNKRVSNIDFNQMPLVLIALIKSTTATYIELFISQFIEVSDRVFK